MACKHTATRKPGEIVTIVVKGVPFSYRFEYEANPDCEKCRDEEWAGLQMVKQLRVMAQQERDAEDRKWLKARTGHVFPSSPTDMGQW